MNTDTQSTKPAEPLDTWAVVELMGHVRTAGKLTEESHFGAALGRLDVPMADGSFTTQFFGGGSVYRITPCSEELAREIAAGTRAAPINPWELRHLLPRPAPERRASDGDRDEEDDAGEYAEEELEEVDRGGPF